MTRDLGPDPCDHKPSEAPSYVDRTSASASRNLVPAIMSA